MRISIVATTTTFLLAACASSKPSGPAPAEVYATGVPGEAAATRIEKVTATVQAVNPADRTLIVSLENGETQTVQVPPAVTRFNEVAVGDRIEAELREGLLLEYQPAGSAFVTPTAVATGARAPSDQAPAAGVAAGVVSTVTITAIDLKSRIVQFHDPGGAKYQVKAGPTLAIEKLSVGDRLLATYVAAVVIKLDKKP